MFIKIILSSIVCVSVIICLIDRVVYFEIYRRPYDCILSSSLIATIIMIQLNIMYITTNTILYLSYGKSILIFIFILISYIGYLVSLNLIKRKLWFAWEVLFLTNLFTFATLSIMHYNTFCVYRGEKNVLICL